MGYEAQMLILLCWLKGNLSIRLDTGCDGRIGRVCPGIDRWLVSTEQRDKIYISLLLYICQLRGDSSRSRRPARLVEESVRSKSDASEALSSTPLNASLPVDLLVSVEGSFDVPLLRCLLVRLSVEGDEEDEVRRDDSAALYCCKLCACAVAHARPVVLVCEVRVC